MTSLREYLFTNTPATPGNAYRRVIGLLLRGISLHAIEGDRSEYHRFRADIDKLESSITPEAPPPEVLRVAGAVTRLLEDYNQRTKRFVRRRGIELQKMIAMLTETVIAIGAGSEQSVARLQEIEKKLDDAANLEHIESVKASLSECLRAVREETLRQKFDGGLVVRKLQKELAEAQERLGSADHAVEVDKVTGLPGYEEAQRALHTALASPGRYYVVAAVVGRVQAINARFGYAVGDRVLNVFRGHFHSGLTASDAVYRWRGPVLLALLEREQTIENVRAEIRPFADTKLETMLEVGARTVLMPISAGWSVFPVVEPFEGLLQKIESFIATQVTHDYC
ncbi:MAG TPA: GGDEF domain-containing protein [Bryobacteraceae bacterium]|nr:GGDEF domain-containing protein [Bryobacteraceae bacterium]